MYDIASRLDAANAPLQLILICGRNEELAAKVYRPSLAHAREGNWIHQGDS